MLCLCPKVSKVSGGITNVLLKLTPQGDHQPVLVRVFGDHTDEVIDRKAEAIISPQLYEAGFGAQVFQSSDTSPKGSHSQHHC